MSSKVLHSHCDSDEKVVPEEPATLASSLVFLLGDYVHVSSLLILSSAFSLNALCHLCTVHCLPSPMAHNTARGAPELCWTPGYPITGLKGKRLLTCQAFLLTESIPKSGLWEGEFHMTGSWTCIPSWVLFKQRMHLYLVQIGKRARPRCSSSMYFSLWKWAFT